MGSSPRETDIGGHRQEFPSTIWSGFLGSFASDPLEARRRLETLAKTYWKPVYAYLRARWARSNEDAKDLTQDFFLWILESGFLTRFDRERGRFRAFLKASLDHYAANVERRIKTLKRGGGRSFLPMDAVGEEPEHDTRDAKPPDVILDEKWRAQLMTTAVGKLEADLRTDGKEVYFKIFREFFLTDSEAIDYRELSERHGVSRTDVSNHLMHAKRRFRDILRNLVADTVDSPEDLDQELAWLLPKETP